MVADEKFMRAALELAKEAEALDEVPIGAVLVVEGEIVAKGFNRRETRGLTRAHAEIEALEELNLASRSWRLPPGTSLYVTMEPCLMCTGAMLWARLDYLYYGCADTKNAGLARVLPWIAEGVFDHRFKSITAGVLAQECAQTVSGYFQKKRSAQRQPE